ncbi:MAG: hypothetical protein N3D10_01785 [Candidatus Micrarchaeota archaeon]|nr:hypothetical protein [Candidatus Micrarchaeota archaeon]
MAEIKNKEIVCYLKEEIEKFSSAGFGKIIDKKLVLHPFEACYLLDLDLIKFEEEQKKEQKVEGKEEEYKKRLRQKILKLAEDKKAAFKAEQRYLVYKEIRSLGRVVRFNNFDPNYWFVYAPGVGREEERAQIILHFLKISDNLKIEELETKLALARQFRMELVIAFFRASKPSYIKLAKYSF